MHFIVPEKKRSAERSLENTLGAGLKLRRIVPERCCPGNSYYRRQNTNTICNCESITLIRGIHQFRYIPYPTFGLISCNGDAMSRSQMVHSHDVRKLIRLVSDVRDVPTIEGRNHLFAQRLAELFHAKVVFVVRGDKIGTSPAGEFSMLAEGGSIDHAERKIYDLYWEGGFEIDPAWLSMMPRVHRPGVFLKTDLIDPQAWYNSAHYNEYRRESRLDEFMYVSSPVNADGSIYAMGINRETGDPPFGQREKTIMSILNEELQAFYCQSCPPTEDIPAKRQRQVLERLLHGDSEIEAAENLGLSPHTVHSYVKQLYKKFGVSSRPELMAQMLFHDSIAE